MKLPSLPRALPLLAAALALPASAAPTIYEMQLITNSGMGGGTANMMGAMLGGGSNVSRSMHLQLTNPGNLPNDYLAAHTVPEGMRIGPQLPLTGERRSSGEASDENPDGRVLIYWGCSATVGKGQPEVIDFRNLAGKLPPEMLAMARQGRSGGKSSGGASLPPRVISWPNVQDTSFRGIPENASAVGAHLVNGNFMSRDIDFTLTPALDFLEPMNLKARSTNLRAAIPLEWSALTRARGYDLQATGAVNDREMIIWLAARNKTPMLPASQRECTIPEGIFAKTEGAMLSGTAHGPVQGFSYPPQKPGEKKPLIWSATVRVTAHDAILLGMEQPAGGSGKESARPSVEESVVDSVVPGAGQLLKGLFGR
jgi:hypothetical protein